ncbi:thyroid adenoma-associated protein isoform X1 [Takifugu flavidus]|uniref:thyroid adenoma-associated protein isoform X1 n=1 Tax=Takifugu flavidus TaxID=433684 RepID=UPI00254477C3|nr:thyroid adenoma-associated protein isoform X1 [Takifugu flavidus]XP_056902919.1 thyroid adenoma-associated protein isoform X1 [Takifugu flavidus]XP_056902920.1 thyroid adenoma-associated protein isoform X1 [Takifugu flavidus]
MVVKKKSVKVEAVDLEEEKLQMLLASLSVGDEDDGVRQLAQTLQSCLELTEPVQQIRLVEKAGSQLELLGDQRTDGALLQACLHTLCLVYTSLKAKNPLRRAIASALASAPVWLQERVVNSLSDCLSECLSDPVADGYSHSVDTISTCLDGFSLGEKCIKKILPEVLQFLHKGLSGHLQQNSGLAGRHVAQAQLMRSCLAAVKASMLVIQRSLETISATLQAELGSSELEETLSNLLGCYVHILTDEEFIQCVQTTAGMAVVLMIRCAMGCGDEVAAVVCGLLHASAQGLDSAPRWVKQRCESLCTAARPLGVSLYLCHGALAMLSWKGAPPRPRWEQLLLLIPNILLDLDITIKESSTAMVVARVLTLWSTAALDCLQGTGQSSSASCVQRSLSGGSELQRRLLEHIYSHWEHPLDGVRYQARSLFHNLLLLHQHSIPPSMSDPNSDPYVSELTQSLLRLEWHMRGKYGSLGCLVELYGAGYLLDTEPALPSCLLGLMGDQSLAPYASDLLEKLFISHKKQLVSETSTEEWMLRWHQTWVTPLLQVLCRANVDQTTYILDYVLPKLLRCSPTSLTHMVHILQQMPPNSKGASISRGALGALMTCLRAARAQGVAPSSEKGLWGGLVPLSLLQQALVHKHDQVRMDALGLVCESHRSTEALTSEEMDLIRHFLPLNLNSQSPGGRQQTVSLLKKLLCRMKDSAVLLQKRLTQEQADGDKDTLQMYKEFLHWFCGTLLEVLLPGASFSKCLMSLQLLCLLGQTFTFSSEPGGFALGHVVTSAHAQNVLYCVASNFLEVKQLASALLRQLPPAAVGLQDQERMRRVLQAALDLSTSTKPFDSVTAAHLLNLLLPHPDLSQALLHFAQQQDLDFAPPPHPSECAMVEVNALAVIQFLLRALQLEVRRAESSLLQAAASCPLYGRAHCITAVLQHLNTESLSLMEEWRNLVSQLVAVCYRMSDVVSPVVQSSSPEGLIPMDSDSAETSAGLQRILQEIQPRDTNDFFNSARELDTHQGDNDTHTPSHISGDEGYRVTAQMVLVCCWRSMKEVAMLLGQLCQSLPLHCSDGTAQTHPGLITEAQVEGVGLYFRQQLLQSRHRGAFELAYVGFVRLTDMLCRSRSQLLQQLPALWLSEVLEEVKSSDPSSKLCATRRSAGIPFFIQALLSSEPRSSSCSLLKMTMRELIALAMPAGDSDGSDVPQVHALNILRALYRDTRLGENIVPFVSEGMQAAVLGFTSAVWAVRNSSTLLFSTLITRIFGVKKGKDEHSKKNRMTGHEFFTRFPALYPFLLNQLEEAAASVESDSGQVKLHPSLFLLLLVLSRLYPSPMDGSSSPLGLAPILPFIMRCGRSAVYRTREMAARALVPFVLVTQVPSTVHTLLQELPAGPGPSVQHNHVHGTLLQVLFLLRSYQTDSHRPLPQGNGICEALHQHMWLASRQNSCVVTRGAFLDVLMCLCGPKIGLLNGLEVGALRRDALSILMTSELVDSRKTPSSSLGPGSTQYLLSLARVALSASVEIPELWGNPELPGQLLQHLLACPDYEVRELTLEQVLKRLLEEEEDVRRPEWLDETTQSHLTSLALCETHPRCLAKVLTVLSVLLRTSELQWSDGVRTLSQEEALLHLLALAEKSSHSEELSCAALTLVSQLVVNQLATSQGDAAVAGLRRWGELVCSCCGEERPSEVKLATAKVLVSCTGSVLSSPQLPLGLPATLSLWRSLFTLLQDEDQDVRAAAADFISTPASPLSAGVPVCPPAALQSGVGLLCRLLQQWGQVPAGAVALAQWLLGDGDAAREAAADEAPGLDEEDFLFEKGDLNLWAEPVQWVRLLHGHLGSLVETLSQDSGGAGPELEQQVRTLTCQAEAKVLSSQQALEALPELPQFSCTMEHSRLLLWHQRASLTLDVLERLRQTR